MITVADIIALPVFDRIELIEPCPGAGRRVVHNVGIMDVSPDFNNYAFYHPGEFILTNLGFVEGSDPAECERAVVAMLERGVSGIAIKCVYGATITDGMRAASRGRGIPVYVYEGAFHEVVAYRSLDLIAQDARASVKNDAIDALVAAHGGAVTRDAVQGLTGMLGASVRCIAMTPQAPGDLSLYAVLSNLGSTLERYREAHGEVAGTYVCLYRDDLLAFVSYDELDGNRDVDGLVRDLRGVARLRCAVGQEVSFADGDLTIRQALMLLARLRESDETSLSWYDLHVGSFALAAGGDRLFSLTARTYLGRLRDHDRATGGELCRTARAFVDAHGDVRAAAQALYQHPNTVRYRLRKMRSILGMAEATDRELLGFLSLVFLV